ncbi:hypothetical protein A0V43_12475 [Geobacillus sp. JS12]|nr:hypothetical protein A0V43_12475 [Geobacillus sp. JS12]
MQNGKVLHVLDEKSRLPISTARGKPSSSSPHLGAAEDGTTTCFTDPGVGLEAALFGRLTVHPVALQKPSM